MTEFIAGKITVDFVLAAHQELVNAKVARASTNGEKTAILEGALETIWILWATSKAKYEAGAIPITQQTGTALEDYRTQLRLLRSKKE
jgi:hypothetical protein